MCFLWDIWSVVFITTLLLCKSVMEANKLICCVSLFYYVFASKQLLLVTFWILYLFFKIGLYFLKVPPDLLTFWPSGLLSSDSVRDSSGRVLVHCQAGISRSATICLAYLMKRKRVRLDEAFEFVRRRRSIISPNFSFMGQLLQFESQLLATSCAAEAAATASPLLGPKSSTTVAAASVTTTPTSPFIFNFPVSVVNPVYLHHSPLTTSPGCWWTVDDYPKQNLSTDWASNKLRVFTDPGGFYVLPEQVVRNDLVPDSKL